MPYVSFEDVLEHIYTTADTTTKQGELFENATVYFLKNDPLWQQRLSDVWLWRDSPIYTGPDTGIDVVAKDAEDGSYWAIQCKCWNAGARLSFKETGTYFATAQADARYQHFMIVDTALAWTKNLVKAAEQVGAIRIDINALSESTIGWSAFLNGQNVAERTIFKPREHQRQAIEECLAGFEQQDRGNLIMACGTGKTLTALRLAEQLCPGGFVLYLTPSISLVSQSLRAWANQARQSMRPFVVCSDVSASKLQDIWQTSVADIPYPSTTDPAKLSQQVNEKPNPDGLTVVFCTYQSIDVISEAQRLGMPQFDLAICDEAHRTTGLIDEHESKSEASSFVKIHDNANVLALKRLYMTATPRIYGGSAKSRAYEDDFMVASMDDESIYGPCFHYLSFGEAVERELLADYRVVVMTVTEEMVAPAFQRMQFAEEGEVKIPEAGKMIGCWKGLSERIPPHSGAAQLGDYAPLVSTLSGIVEIESADQLLSATHAAPLHHAVAFTSTIKESKRFSEQLQAVVDAYIAETGDTTQLRAEAQHIDGTMSSTERKRLLEWLGQRDPDSNSCHILSNARCLSEGVDVPNLDAVLFMQPRNSRIDIIQAVGRVMRMAEGKDYGYIILPVFVASGMTPEEALDKTKTFETVWQVLQALRSHDERLEAKINALSFEQNEVVVVKALDPSKLRSRREGEQPLEYTYQYIVDNGDKPTPVDAVAGLAADIQLRLQLETAALAELAQGINAQIVKRCGNRVYWEDWADDIAQIALRHIEQIRQAVTTDNDADSAADNAANSAANKASVEFERFLAGLRDSLNPGISREAAIEMLAQHIITLPVFEALFGGSGFAQSNPVSIAMEQMVSALGDHASMVQTRIESLSELYASVARRADAITTDAGRQKLIKELYEKFFSKAFKSSAEKMGIVYTPNEVVDYMLHATDRMLRREFGSSLGSPDVHILDPFAGTGTFLANLIASDLISDSELPNKYQHELHSNEIVLLAYYIMTINIEHAYHARIAGSYQPFTGALLTDTFQMSEGNDTLDIEVFIENSERLLQQNALPIKVIIGNPPYSVGQRSANDNNPNESYPTLDRRLRETYVDKTGATNKNALYDSYVRAFRWASDRIGDAGIVCFVSNAGWLDGQAMDGFRQCLVEEFSSIYVFNLRGDARTSGEQRRKEKGNVFGGGTRTPVAITMLVKNPASETRGRIHYHDIGDYLNREEKLAIIKQQTYDDSQAWTELTPDAHNDWLNLRDDSFKEFAPMGLTKYKEPMGIFATWSRGVATSRDAWAVNYSTNKLGINMEAMIDAYNKECQRYKDSDRTVEVRAFVDQNPKGISWSTDLYSLAEKAQIVLYESYKRTLYNYRPYCKQWMYYDQKLNERTYQQLRLFPLIQEEGEITGKVFQNYSICISQGKESLPLIIDILPDIQIIFNAQCFPLYWYEKQEPLGGMFEGIAETTYQRHDAITDEAMSVFRCTYGKEITKEDIFYYIYGVLHSPEYRQRFGTNLAKELPRIPLSRNFKAFSEAGRRLALLHLNYESVEPYPLVEDGDSINPGRTTKMRFGSVAKTEDNPRGEDMSVLQVSSRLTLRGIPEEAYRYVVNGKSAIGWLMDRYMVTTDKASGIENDPNEYSDDQRYIVDLVKRVVRVSVETIEIVDDLPALDEMEQPAEWPVGW